MNTRERINAILNYRDFDRVPVMHFGYWKELLDEWAAQGHISQSAADSWGDGNATCRMIAGMLGFDADFQTIIEARNFIFPQFAPQVVAEFADGGKHFRDGNGVTTLVMPGAGSIPAEIEHLLVDRRSWLEHYRWRLTWNPERLPENIREVAAAWNASTDHLATLHVGSILGELRNWVGMVNLSYLQIDDPELLEEMVDTIADTAYRNAEAWLAAGLRPDLIHWWEDICYNHGPLVSPAFFAQTAVKHYRRMTGLFRQYDCKLASVDCDGAVEILLPHWLEGGVNVIFPIEIGTWHPDFPAWRQQYGRELRGIGGMNKHVLSLDKAAVDAEVERLKSWMAIGGFLPCPDHRLPPGTKWELVQYYCEKMRELKFI